MAAKSCRKIEVLKAADEILGFLGEAKEPPTLREISLYTGLSTDSTFRQLGTMVDLRWVEKIGDVYMPGMRMAVFWARKKARLLDKREVIDKKLAELEDC